VTSPRDPRRARSYRYGAWHGGPDPLAAPYDVGAALDAVGEEVLAGQSLRDALRDLLRRGLPDGDGRRGAGLEDLRARAQRMRRDAARRGRLDGALTRAAQKLDQALAEERSALALRGDDDDARFAEARLDALPRSTAAAVRELADYTWTDKDAERLYNEILDELRRDVLDQQFRGLRDALSGMQPGSGDAAQRAASAALKDMLSDLNNLLAKHARGQDTTEAFEQFMAKHGAMFPERPESVEELIDALARRAAAAQQLMSSLTGEQRAELQQLMAQALGDADLAAQLAGLSDNLRALRPDLPWQRGERMRGDTPLGYGEAVEALQEIAELDAVLDALAQDSPGSTLDDIDVEAVERALGSQAAQDVRALQHLERELERQGWLIRSDDGLELSPQAMRRLGQTALRQVFATLKAGARGDHDEPDAGAAGEPTGASRPWEFGDEQSLDVVRTVSNAVRRTAGSGGRGDVGVRLAVEDFEVVETERRASAAVALCVDLSYSMISQGRWGPMKQTALALAHLVATRFRQDYLQIIGFGRYAAKLSLEQLAGVEPDYVQGTNLHHALIVAGRHVRRHPDSEPVVLVVTDGEPTAHLVAGTHAVFDYPPSRETITSTIAEVDALTRYGAAINVFMLGEDSGLRRFVDAVAQRNGGRVFTPDVDRLGAYVVSDYLKSRRGRRR